MAARSSHLPTAAGLPHVYESIAIDCSHNSNLHGGGISEPAKRNNVSAAQAENLSGRSRIHPLVAAVELIHLNLQIRNISRRSLSNLLGSARISGEQAAQLKEHRITSICAMLTQKATFDIIQDVQQEVKVRNDFSRSVTSVSVSTPTETVRFMVWIWSHCVDACLMVLNCLTYQRVQDISVKARYARATGEKSCDSKGDVVQVHRCCGV